MFSGGRKEAGMGIFIDLYIAEDVTDEEWAPVYEESLKLARAFHLMDSQAPEMYGHRLVCGIPSGQKGGERGWRAVGDSVTMGRAEEQSLPEREGVDFEPLLWRLGQAMENRIREEQDRIAGPGPGKGEQP